MLFLSILAYAGAAALILGGIALIKPVRRLGLATRRRALVPVLAGVAFWAAAFAWPTPTVRVPQVASAIDEIMPAYQFVEHHETTIRARPKAVFEAVKRVTSREIQYFRLLTWIRNPRIGRTQESILAAPTDKPLLGVALASGFVLLKELPDREIVIGARVAPAVHAVMNFHIRRDDHGESLLTTETRVLASHDSGRRAFAIYWRFIYPGSALIRVEWLRAIKRRAEVQSSGQ